ncbi:DUF6647 family protein [Limimonas halophila]|nr:DUF6647 family protein [Limimonas halophila]
MDGFMVALMTWIASVSGLPEPENPPAVRRLSAEEIVARARPPQARQPHAGRSYVALYRAGTRTILLRDDWSRDSLRDRSILVHELVHHMQAAAGRDYPCPGAREREAYGIQGRWLKRQGGSLSETLGINTLHLLLLTRCGR